MPDNKNNAMKNKCSGIVLVLFFSMCTLIVHSQEANKWSKHKVKKWLATREWAGGLTLRTHPSVNV